MRCKACLTDHASVQDAELEQAAIQSQEEVEHFHQNLFEQLNLSVGPNNTTLAQLTWAKAMVMSRAFLFSMPDDSYKYAVAPILELLNHEPDAETEYFYDSSVRLDRVSCTASTHRVVCRRLRAH